MKLRDIANVIMTGRECARRTNGSFELRLDAGRILGASEADMARVMKAVRDIEHFTEVQLAKLDRS